MRKIGISLLSSVVLASLLLAGCATTETDLQTRESAQVASDLNKVAAEPAAPMNTSSVQVMPTNYVGADVSRNLHGDPLPARWMRGGIQIAQAGAASFQDVANAITKATGIPVSVSLAGEGDVSALNTNPVGSSGIPAATQTQTGGGASDAAQPGLAQGPIPTGFNVAAALSQLRGSPSVTTTAAAAGGALTSFPGTMRISWSGNLSGFLDLVAANFNIGWEYDNGRILFSRTVTQVFDVPALPVLANLKFNMESTAGGDSSGSGGTDGTTSGQTATTQSGFDLWTDLQNTLGGIVANTGVFKLSSQTGQVIVVAPPSTVDRVASYLKQLNAQLNKQVAITVNVYSVTLGDGDNYASNIQALLPNAGDFGLSFNSTGTANTGGLGWAVMNGPLNGSNGLLQALSSRHDVSTVTSASVTALNGVPVPVQVANTQAYAKDVSISVSNGTTTGSVTPGSVTTGFNLQLVPKVLRNGNILLQYGMNLSELNAIANFAVPGGGNIQLPNVTQRNFIQQAQIPNGDTLVLAGFQQVRAESTGSGPLHSGLWFLGGNRTSSMDRNIIVIAITPTVLDVSPQAKAANAQ